MRYDAVLLNEVFPFNLIEPSMGNAAMYFYNCLEDTLTLMDLVLKEISLGETPDLSQRVSTRNTDMDGLHYQEGILQDLRKKLYVQEPDKSDHGIKNRLGQVFRS
jgi:hypothetical protein